jgi:hypothetical protein
VPIPVLAFLYFCPISVLARSITGTGIKWCQYRYWHICSFVQYQYWHGTLPVLPLLGARTGIGVLVLWFIISIGMVHYRYWHWMVPVLVSAFMHFGPVPVSTQYTTGMGIKWCPCRYWHFCTLVQYQYGHGPLPVLALNGASTGNVNEHYAKCHKVYASTSIVPPLLGALLELVICANWYPVV